MFSHQDPQAVMTGLGDKFVTNLASSVHGARADLAELREWRPSWFPPRPDLPAVDLYDGAREDDQGEEGASS